jgi:hypothetical protein
MTLIHDLPLELMDQIFTTGCQIPPLYHSVAESWSRHPRRYKEFIAHVKIVCAAWRDIKHHCNIGQVTPTIGMQE